MCKETRGAAKHRINSNQILRQMKKFVEPPFDQICRHTAAIDLYTICEKSGMEMPPELAASLVSSSNGDTESIKILNEMIKNEESKDS